MRIPRIYVPGPLQSGCEIGLPDQAAHHVRHVLRLQTDAELVLFDGRGGDYPARISAITKRGLSATVGVHRDYDCESTLEIELGLGISKGDRMDYSIQKATELGVTRIVPLDTERSTVALSGDRGEKKWEHWRGVVVSACEQCGRNRLPELAKPLSFDAWVSQTPEESKFVLSPTASQSFREHPPATARVALVIGPEGGLSESEIRLAEHFGFKPTRLGPRVLRTETAAVAAITAIQTLWGDL